MPHRPQPFPSASGVPTLCIQCQSLPPWGKLPGMACCYQHQKPDLTSRPCPGTGLLHWFKTEYLKQWHALPGVCPEVKSGCFSMLAWRPHSLCLPWLIDVVASGSCVHSGWKFLGFQGCVLVTGTPTLFFSPKPITDFVSIVSFPRTCLSA